MLKHCIKIFLVFFICATAHVAKAQWVTIPDSNFVNFLTDNYPSCMNGNLMDTTCSAVVNETDVNCSSKNIYDLEGIQYFDSLTTLWCADNQLTSLPNLPILLNELNCGGNLISNLPILPQGLSILACGGNQLTNLPTLPNSIIALGVESNLFTNLPTLPNSLQNLYSSSNLLTSLPPLPNSLSLLYCNANQLTTLPSLPNSLKSLICFDNPLSNMPTLPNSLLVLDCSFNQLTSIPTLPFALNYFSCHNNQLTIIPSLPNSIETFACGNNQLTSLPSLPSTLQFFSCDNNQLGNLPVLPASLKSLVCSNNPLLNLPLLPDSITELRATSTLITSVPDLPDSLSILLLAGNPNLTCLPKLTRIEALTFFNTGIQCLPNYGRVTISSPSLSSLPICDLFNTNNCTVYWDISGKVYGDTNSNCVNDINEFGQPNLKLLLDSSGVLIQQTYTGGEGFYSFDTDTGTYNYTVDTTGIPVYVTCPLTGFQTSVLTAIDSMDYDMDFGMQCKPGFDVGVKSIVRDSGIFRPAHFVEVRVGAGDMSNFFGLQCAAGMSGEVNVVMSGPVSFVAPAAGALTPLVSGDTLLYSIPDFGTVNFNSAFEITVKTDTNATIGSSICFSVDVAPVAGDINTGNNFLQDCFTVANSVDPNQKEVFPQGNIDTSQHWLTYTINFQNTGTAPAQHIYILDTLDNNLDASSFELLSYNHQPLTQIFENVVRFNFPNINLPDSVSDEPNSHGYVQYKIKLKPGLTNGTFIRNTANIYFDFNSPVITNTTINQIAITTSVPLSWGEGSGVRCSPNPFHDYTVLKINSPKNLGKCHLEIYNVIGERIREINFYNKNEIVIERINLREGIYIFKLMSEKELITTGKLIVQ